MTGYPLGRGNGADSAEEIAMAEGGACSAEIVGQVPFRHKRQISRSRGRCSRGSWLCRAPDLWVVRRAPLMYRNDWARSVKTFHGQWGTYRRQLRARGWVYSYADRNDAGGIHAGPPGRRPLTIVGLGLVESVC